MAQAKRMNRPLGSSHTAKQDPAGTILSPQIEATTLEEIVARFEVGDPIKTLFRPRFTVHRQHPIDMPVPMNAAGYSPAGVIQLEIQAPDAYGERGVIPVMTQRFVFPDELPGERYVQELLRSMLMDIIQHEVDESILYSGERIFDPHKHERH